MDDLVEQHFQRTLKKIKPDEDVSRREKKQLKQPVTKVRPDNIFTWNLNKHTLFEEETDPKLIRSGQYFRRVGIVDGNKLTEGQIVAQEKRLGIDLPAPWREVYKHFNGGWVGTLFWGDLNNPKVGDIEPIPQSSHQFLALEDVAPLRDLLPQILEGLENHELDPNLIAIACAHSQAVILDYRKGAEPRVCLAYFSQFSDDPLAEWEQDKFSFWWPNMEIFFRGLYLQDRII